MKHLSNYRLFTEELQLNLAELSKSRNGKKRGDILVGKIKTEDPLIIDKTNKSVKIEKIDDGEGKVLDAGSIDDILDTGGEYDPEKAKNFLTNNGRYKKVFIGDDNEKYQLNQFKKTSDFGSKGAGSKTRQFEAIQCIYLGIRQGLFNKNEESMLLSSRNVRKSFNNYRKISQEVGSLVHFDENISITEDIVSEFLSDPDWVNTFCKIPNRLWLDKNRIDKNLLYAIYHISCKSPESPYQAIKSKYLELAREGKFGNIDINKFCPADVYLVSIAMDEDTNDRDLIVKEINSVTNINDLISTMNKFFDNKKLIPLSLKKVNKDGKFKIITNNQNNSPSIEFIFDGVNISNDVMMGIGSKIVVKSVWKKTENKILKMNFDSSDTSKKIDIDGEVDGSASRHGKVNFNYIKSVFSKKISKLEPKDVLYKKTEHDIDIELSEIYSKIKSLIKKSNKSSSNMRGRKLDTINKKISKLQSLQVVYYILKLNSINPLEANRAVTDIFKYALSIQSNKFITPRYLRVI